MRALVFVPGKAAAEADIGDDLETLQRLVGGYIETATGFDLPEGATAYVNEDGATLELERNRGYRGTIVIVGFDADGAQIALTDEQIAEILGAVG